MNENKLEVEITIHYQKDDKKFFGDYSDIEISVTGRVIKSYGDDYHDQGQAKMEGFCDAFKCIYGDTMSFKTVRVADREW